MRTRFELHEKLCDILGSRYVYYRKPSRGIKYPCIIYDLEGEDARYADDTAYIIPRRWNITIIDQNPDSEIGNRLRDLRYCRFDRSYEASGMNHFVYTLYF